MRKSRAHSLSPGYGRMCTLLFHRPTHALTKSITVTLQVPSWHQCGGTSLDNYINLGTGWTFLVHEGIWFLLTLSVLIAEQGHVGEGRAWRGPFCLAPTHLSEHQVAARMSWEQGHDDPKLSPPSLLILIRWWDPNHLAYPFSWGFSSTDPLFW